MTAIGDFVYAGATQYTFNWEQERQENNTLTMVRITGDPFDGSLGNSNAVSYRTHTFDIEGTQWIRVTGTNSQGEEYYAWHWVDVYPAGIPVNSEPQDISSTGKEQGWKAVKETLKGEGSLLVGLFFLSLPMVYALGTTLKWNSGITANSLKQNFYVHCYYFSPTLTGYLGFLAIL